MPPKKGKKKNKNKSAAPTDPVDRLKLAGNTAFAAGDWQAAVGHYTEAIALAPDNRALFSNRSAAFVELGQLPEAQADAEQCVTLAADWPKAWYRLGLAQLRQGDLVGARESLQRGLTMAPDNAELSTALVECVGAADDPSDLMPNSDSPDNAKFRDLLLWLKRGGATFPKLYMEYYSPSNRGVHALVNIPNDEEIMRIPKEFLITVEMGKECPIGQKMLAAHVDLTATKHCYLSVFCLWDRKTNPDSFFQPYYNILPESYSFMPIFWTEEELQYLEGSYLLQQIADRKTNIEADYEEIAEAAPEFRELCTLEEFSHYRMAMASRNFGVEVNGIKTDALVPLADMLNHKRPRETRWTFDKELDSFTITSVEDLSMGAQIFDSYGRKCNSRFLLNYGFSVEANWDGTPFGATGHCYNEARLFFLLDEDAPGYETKLQLLCGIRPGRGIRVSMQHGDKNTAEALSYLRFIYAQGTEVIVLPQFTDDFDLQESPIEPISIENELLVLQRMAQLAMESLVGYPTTVEEDEARLASGELEPYTNEHNALVHVRGEKQVLQFWVQMVDIIRPLFDLSWAELKKKINKEHMNANALDKYIRYVVKPLVQKRPAAQ